MTKITVRFVALILVSALVADPALSAGLQTHQGPTLSDSLPFVSQALIARADCYQNPFTKKSTLSVIAATRRIWALASTGNVPLTQLDTLDNAALANGVALMGTAALLALGGVGHWLAPSLIIGTLWGLLYSVFALTDHERADQLNAWLAIHFGSLFWEIPYYFKMLIRQRRYDLSRVELERRKFVDAHYTRKEMLRMKTDPQLQASYFRRDIMSQILYIGMMLGYVIGLAGGFVNGLNHESFTEWLRWAIGLPVLLLIGLHGFNQWILYRPFPGSRFRFPSLTIGRTRAKTEELITSRIAHLPNMMVEFLKTQTDSSAQILLETRLLQIDRSFETLSAEDRQNHVLIQALLNPSSSNNPLSARSSAISETLRHEIASEMLESESIIGPFCSLVNAYNLHIQQAEDPERLALIQLLTDGMNAYSIDATSAQHMNVHHPGVDVYRADMDETQTREARTFRFSQTVDFLQTSGNASRLKRSLTQLLQVAGFSQKEISLRFGEVLEGGLYFVNMHRILTAIYEKQFEEAVARGKIQAGQEFICILKIAPGLDIAIDGLEVKDGNITLTRDLLRRIPDIHIGELHWFGMAATIRHDAQQLGLDPDSALQERPVILSLTPANTDRVIRDLRRNNYYGFNPDLVYIVEQPLHPLFKMDDPETLNVMGRRANNRRPFGVLPPLMNTMNRGAWFRASDPDRSLKNASTLHEELATRFHRPVTRVVRINDLSADLIHPEDMARDNVALHVSPDYGLGLYHQVSVEMHHGAVVSNPLTSNPLNQKGSWPIELPDQNRTTLLEALGMGFITTGGESSLYSKYMPFIRFGDPEAARLIEQTLPHLPVTFAVRFLDEEETNRSPVGLQLDIPFSSLNVAGLPFQFTAQVNEKGIPSERILDFKELRDTPILVAALTAMGRSTAEFPAVDSLFDSSFPDHPEAEKLREGMSDAKKSFVRDGDDLMIRKEAQGPGKAKLLKEIQWLLNLPRKLQAHFPVVLNYNKVAETVFYQMPFYPLYSLTDLIFRGRITVEKVLKKLERILTFYSQDLNSFHNAPAPKNYAVDTLGKRIRERLIQTIEKSPTVFKSVIEAEFLYINGTRLRNVRPLLNELDANRPLQKTLQPPYLKLVHGDLHFENVLIGSEDDDDFILLDPRGDEQGDPMYDIAKILHTIVGKYDIFNHDLHQVQLTQQNGYPSIQIDFPKDSHVWEMYEALELEIIPLLMKSLKGIEVYDPFWLWRAMFTHAALFSGIMRFHLKGSDDPAERQALAMYAMGVLLMNRFMDTVRSLQAKGAFFTDAASHFSHGLQAAA